jgi:hypothetical protein
VVTGENIGRQIRPGDMTYVKRAVSVRPGYTDIYLFSHTVLYLVYISFGKEREDPFPLFFLVMGISLFECAFNAIANHLAFFYFNAVFLIDAKIPFRIQDNTIADVAIDPA